MQSQASMYASDLQNQQYQQNRTDMAPWREQGANALGSLADLMGTSGNTGAQGYGRLTQPFQFQTSGPNADPSYQWRYDQGLNAQNQNAALGGYFRGQTGIDLQSYGQGMASQEYGAQFNRQQAENTNIYNMLAGLSGTGQAATQQTGQMGMQSATNQGMFGVQGAQAMGQGMTGAANAYAGMYQNFGNQLMGGTGAYMNYNMMNNYLNGQNSLPQQQWSPLDTSLPMGGR
jgi:hypothetical protein